jgi:hypothetical protein
MSPRGKWAGFRIQRDDGEFYEIELNARGQLLEALPRLPRRRNHYSGETPFEQPPLRVARLTGLPSIGFDEMFHETDYPLDGGELEDENEQFRPFEEANPEPYTGLLGDSLFNDSFSFGDRDEYETFDPFFLGF